MNSLIENKVTNNIKVNDIVNLIIDNSNIKVGNVIVGLSSSGTSSYDKEYNSGIGSNGLTSARHDVISDYIKQRLSASNPTIDNSFFLSYTRIS